MTKTPKNVERVQNSDPRGRAKDNVPREYFGGDGKRGRGTSMCGLRPSFFAMLRREAEKSNKGE